MLSTEDINNCVVWMLSTEDSSNSLVSMLSTEDINSCIVWMLFTEYNISSVVWMLSTEDTNSCLKWMLFIEDINNCTTVERYFWEKVPPLKFVRSSFMEVWLRHSRWLIHFQTINGYLQQSDIWNLISHKYSVTK